MKDFDPATTDPDQVRWFSTLGACRCGKPATGTLMGQRNEIYAASCHRCADKRLKRAKAERDAAETYRLAQPPGPSRNASHD